MLNGLRCIGNSIIVSGPWYMVYGSWFVIYGQI